MPEPMLNAFDGLPGIALVPMPIEGFCRYPELDDEVAGQVRRLGLSPFLAPEAHNCGFVGAHDDPGVRAANKALSPHYEGMLAQVYAPMVLCVMPYIMYNQ